MTRITISKIAALLFMLLFVLAIHINIPNFGSPLILPVGYIVWIFVSAIIMLSLLHMFHRSSFAIPSIIPYILIFIASILITLLFNPVIDYHSAIYKTAGLVAGVLFFLALHQFDLSEDQKEKILYSIVTAGGIEAAIGLLQYLGPGFGIPLLVSPLPSVVYIGRVLANFQQPNVFASFLATALVVSVFLLKGRSFLSLAIFYKILFFVIQFVMLFLLFLTGSRIGLFGLFFSVLILLISNLRHYNNHAKRYVIIWLVILILAFILGLQTRVVGQLGHKFNSTYNSLLGNKVSDNRIPIYLTTFMMLQDKPLVGHGLGSFSSKFILYRNELGKVYPDYPRDGSFTTHPHNEFLYILAESGLVGLAGLLLLTGVFLLYLFKLGREKGGAYASMLIPIVFHTQVEFPFYQSVTHWVLFLFLLYLPSSQFVRCKRFRLHPYLKTTFSALAAGFFILVSLMLIHTMSAQLKMFDYVRLLSQKDEIRTDLLFDSLDNPYLGQLSARLYMDAKLRTGLMKGDMRLVRSFLDWSRNEVKIFPAIPLYVRQARALFALDRRDEAYEVLKEGLSLYPGERVLSDTRKQFILEEAKESLLRRYERNREKKRAMDKDTE